MSETKEPNFERLSLLVNLNDFGDDGKATIILDRSYIKDMLFSLRHTLSTTDGKVIGMVRRVNCE